MSALKRVFLSLVMILPVAALSSSLQLLRHADNAPVTTGKIDPGNGSGGSTFGTIVSKE